MIDSKRKNIFWEVIDVLNKSSLLPHIVIIGSWAEYLFSYYFEQEFSPNFMTRDIDLYFGNFYLEVPGSESLKENFKAAGFIFSENYGQSGRFFKEGIEVEFLSSTLGKGAGIIELPLMGVKAEKLQSLSLLTPVAVKARGYTILIPTPQSYIAHKLYINPIRREKEKQVKDIEAIRYLLSQLQHMPHELKNLQELIENYPSEIKEQILSVAKFNGLKIIEAD